MSTPTESVSLQGRRVLVIEDEALITMLVEDMLTELGCVMAGTATRIPEAVKLAQSADVDVALLDLNLGGQKSIPVADVLAARGVPFIWVSGATDAIPKPHDARPALAKPFDLVALQEALRCILLGS